MAEITTERSEKQRFQHDGISSKIAKIESIFLDSNIGINNSHKLLGLLRNAKDLALAWAKSDVENTDMNKLFCALHVERIYQGVQSLEFEDNKEKYLKDLLNGTLDFFERRDSHAKNILWELEVFRKIKKVIPETYLEEPDIVANINQCRIAIPCKKTYSENGVPKALSKAVSQIENDHEFGIVAMNIDDLIPEAVLLRARTFKEAGDKLHNINMNFLARHEHHFLKYLSKSRILAVIASTSMVTDIADESPQFNNFSQWAIWTIPGLKTEHQNALNYFRSKVIG
ncbi:hypothetical protein [Zhongshania borealis]|uniref:Uncharacterized protein n=1 Tax=Zhongshania borealis TaxID=889488 RepID=A0ABP7W9L8_9GAMM